MSQPYFTDTFRHCITPYRHNAQLNRNKTLLPITIPPRSLPCYTIASLGRTLLSQTITIPTCTQLYLHWPRLDRTALYPYQTIPYATAPYHYASSHDRALPSQEPTPLCRTSTSQFHTKPKQDPTFFRLLHPYTTPQYRSNTGPLNTSPCRHHTCRR